MIKTVDNSDMKTGDWLNKFIQAAHAVDLTPLQLFTAATIYKAALDQFQREEEADRNRPTIDELQYRHHDLERRVETLERLMQNHQHRYWGYTGDGHEDDKTGPPEVPDE